MLTSQNIADAIAFEIYLKYRQNNKTIDVLIAKNAIELALKAKSEYDQNANLVDLLEKIEQILAKKIRDFIDSNPDEQYKIENSNSAILIDSVLADGTAVNRVDAHIQSIIDIVKQGAALLVSPSAKSTIDLLKNVVSNKVLEVFVSPGVSNTAVAFFSDLGKEIERVERTTYGNKSKRDEKVIVLLELQLIILRNTSQNIKAAITEFNTLTTASAENYYNLICTQRRTGPLSFLNPKKTRTQELIDKYHNMPELENTIKQGK